MRYLVSLALLCGCTLFEDDPPDNTCESDKDCFVAQGETCNLDTQECEATSASPDGGTP